VVILRAAEGELSDSDLERVAGGKQDITANCLVLGGTAVSNTSCSSTCDGSSSDRDARVARGRRPDPADAGPGVFVFRPQSPVGAVG
jgi:hypothetical protein